MRHKCNRSISPYQWPNTYTPERCVWEWKLKLNKKRVRAIAATLQSNWISRVICSFCVNILVRIKTVFLSDSTKFIEISIEFHSCNVNGSSVISFKSPLTLSLYFSSMGSSFYGATDLNRLHTHKQIRLNLFNTYMIFVLRACAHQISQLWMQIDTRIVLCFCGGVTNKFRSDKQHTLRKRDHWIEKRKTRHKREEEREKKATNWIESFKNTHMTHYIFIFAAEKNAFLFISFRLVWFGFIVPSINTRTACTHRHAQAQKSVHFPHQTQRS